MVHNDTQIEWVKASARRSVTIVRTIRALGSVCCPGVVVVRMVALLRWFIPEVQACHNVLAIFILVSIQNLLVSAVVTSQAVEYAAEKTYLTSRRM